MAKTTLVALECKALGVREFEISHAERILNMKPNGGWELADKNFNFKNGIIERNTKKTNDGTGEKADN